MNEIQQQQQYYNMVNTSKMGDLDINLITLYARTPALYDKRNPFYKDKQYSERAWNDISMKLGYKVEILKDRMLQLRNRYNLEKRKIEGTRTETSPNPKSSWPLYKYLLFFDGHIKQRRSYKMLKKIQDAEADKARSDHRGETSSQANSSANESFHGDISMLSKLIRDRSESLNTEIKNEEDSDLDMVEAIPILNENSSDNQIFNYNNANGAKNGNDACSTSSYKMTNSVDNNSNGPPQMTMIPQHPYAATTSTPFDGFSSLDKKFNKYNAFGQFIAASLADLSDEKATDVMQRITMEIFAAQRDLN
ncbi:unnamed protein product [Chironomus riparius]|uniref:MADF domain-containing protein n=1 Tax=Chironomus riparius TaxID=315576 RepID=A0A9N9WTA1_9DIPT|nr:unnamed protein product [Chironomus riparius]